MSGPVASRGLWTGRSAVPPVGALFEEILELGRTSFLEVTFLVAVITLALRCGAPSRFGMPGLQHHDEAGVALHGGLEAA